MSIVAGCKPCKYEGCAEELWPCSDCKYSHVSMFQPKPIKTNGEAIRESDEALGKILTRRIENCIPNGCLLCPLNKPCHGQVGSPSERVMEWLNQKAEE